MTSLSFFIMPSLMLRTQINMLTVNLAYHLGLNVSPVDACCNIHDDIDFTRDQYAAWFQDHFLATVHQDNTEGRYMSEDA